MINYYLLTKPGIILGNLITVAAGFLLASKGRIDAALFLATLLGLGFIIASACVLNNYIDRGIDRKMQRTKKRALAQGAISGLRAIVFAFALGSIGCLILFFYTNLLTVCISLLGLFVYVIPYSLWKCHTLYSTGIGSIAGAVPPVAGYTAACNHFDLGAFILFTMLVFWQMPHFFAIATLHFDDYAKAGIQALPIQKGMLRTKIHMLVYITGFIIASFLLTYLNYTGYLYLTVAMSLGFFWLLLCITGFASNNNLIWGKRMFQLSLLLICAISLIIPLDVI